MHDQLYERAKGKIQLAVYFAKEMIEELGKERALEIIGKAYQKFSNDTFPEPYLDIPMEKRFQKFREDLKAKAEQEAHLTIVEDSDRHIKVRFDRCPTYEVYADYGIPEVCQKYCDGDFEAFRHVHPNIKVTREHEIAYGDAYCDHCWTLEK
jgi:predicted ArsR family transcriptional regulator